MDRPLVRPRASRRQICGFLPSGLSPSVLEFHQVNRLLAASGSRTVTAGSDLHRPRNTHEMSTRRAHSTRIRESRPAGLRRRGRGRGLQRRHCPSPSNRRPRRPRRPVPSVRRDRWPARAHLVSISSAYSPAPSRTAPRQRSSRCSARYQYLVGPLPVVAVVVRQQRQPDGHRVDAGAAQRRDEDQVAARLGHLLPVQADHPAVQVRLGERPAARHGPRPRDISWCGNTRSVPPACTSNQGRAGPARSRCTRCASPVGRSCTESHAGSPGLACRIDQAVQRRLLAGPVRIPPRSAKTSRAAAAAFDSEPNSRSVAWAKYRSG